MRTWLLSCLALIAFAGNSVLCRLALSPNMTGRGIDPTSFTVVRLVSGIIMLFVILLLSGQLKSDSQSPSANEVPANKASPNGSWFAGLSLFFYAALFSYAYVTLDTATGALILFGSVQITMITLGHLRGQKLSKLELFGCGLAIIGFVYLFLPQLRQPSLLGFVLMVLAGIAWGDYTLRGQGSINALMTTAFNFLRTLPMVIVLLVGSLVFGGALDLTAHGLALAIASGAITSGIGYAIWYSALPNLSTTQAAVMQLLVPIIAALGGVLFADELISARLVIAAVLVLGGVLLVIVQRAKIST